MISSVSKLYSNLKEAYSKLNPATLSGAIDAIIVEQADGTYLSSPFHVRFGKLGILQPKEREVDIEVNGRFVDLRMVLDDNGTAYFMAPSSQNDSENNNNNGLSASSSSLVNASSTEEIADLLMQDDPEDNEVNQIFSNGANQVLSDPEQSPVSSPLGFRAQSPSAKSDSEAPTVKWTDPAASKLLENSKSGKFLDEITSSREDLMPIYLGANEKDDDVESGKGVSMPQSPQPVSAMSRVHEIVPSNSSSSVPLNMSPEYAGEVALSLCGPLIGPDGEISVEEFQQYRLPWEAFERDPLRHVANFDLYVWNVKQDANSTSGKIKCLPWSVYSAQLAAQCVFGRVLSDEQVSLLSTRCNAERIATNGSSWFRSLIPRRAAKPIVAPAPAGPSDRALRPNITADNILLQDNTNNQQQKPPISLTPSTASTTQVSTPNVTSTPSTPPNGDNGTASGIAPTVASRMIDVRYATDDDEDEAMYGTKNASFLEVNRINSSNGSSSSAKEHRHPPLRRRGLSVGTLKSNSPRRTRRLTTEQVKALELEPGENLFAFSVSHQILGTTRLTCRVFVWRWDDRLVISDIDGTITKSDVLGQVLPIMGLEWTQPGVTKLFTLLVKNNYKIMYLSARAIGLAQQTREYLCSIDGLPPGPLLLSPASLVNAFYKEVIERVPERFKINCLREITKLFPQKLDVDSADGAAVAVPQHHSPFYAGFGNRPNDSKAYRAVCVPPSRIFIVNPRAEVRMETGCYKSTYDTLADNVDLFFPSYTQNSVTPVHNEFSSFEYWRPKPDI